MVDQVKQKRFLKARITFLEMYERSQQFIVPPSSGIDGEPLALMRAKNCPAHFYQYLYRQVGKQHHWEKRRNESLVNLSKLLHAETTRIYTLYSGGCPAGFAETKIVEKEEKREAEIVYFGLIPDYQGLGLSRFFLNEVLKATWAEEVYKICIQTNSLDNPRALQLYQKSGFTPVATQDVEIEAWD